MLSDSADVCKSVRSNGAEFVRVLLYVEKNSC